MSLCFECERRDCVCSQPTDESLSITSEDDLPQGGVFKTQERDLSFISGDESEAENDLGSSGLLPPPAKDQSSHPPTSQRELLFPPPPSHQDTRSADCSDPLEKEVKVSDFRPEGAESSYADLSVFSVYSAQDESIAPQEVRSVCTNILLSPELNALEQHPAIFNFCPMGLDAKNTSLAVKACQIMGGAIYIGHQTTKRLKVHVLNPGSFAPLAFPKDTLLGVLEVYFARY